MNKTFGLIGLSVLMVAVLALFAAAVPLCSDSDGGKDVWTAGTTTDFNGPNEVTNADDCDGASENLKEFYCDGDIGKLDNIKCTDFNAVCITVGDKTVGDYCACPEGYDFVVDKCVAQCVGCECTNSCGDFCTLHPTDPKCNSNPGVPEYPVFTMGLAVIGAGLGLAFLRKK